MTSLQNNKDPFKERLNNSRDAIINHIRKIHPNSDIKVMTNKSEMLNRAQHFGAHICVGSSHYYYITFSRKDEFCERCFSINSNLLKQLHSAVNKDWHLLLITGGYIYTFDARTIIDNAKCVCTETDTYKVSLDAANSKDDIDFRYAYNDESTYNIDFTYLGIVRYSKKFDMHKKQITICTNYVDNRRVTYDSIVKAYAALTGAKVENGKIIGKPAANAAYKKSYKSFLREVKAESLLLIDANGKEFKATVILSVVPTVGTEAPAEVSTSLLVDNNTTTNSDVDIASDDQENCNIGNVADKPPVNSSRTTSNRKLAEEDKLINTLAQRMVDKQETLSEQDIKKAVVGFGLNKHMLEAYVEGLKDKNLLREAVYATKLFDILNNVEM